MQEKYELRVTLTNSTAINILKGLNNYGLKRKIIESAIIKFAKGKATIQIDLDNQMLKSKEKSKILCQPSQTKEVLEHNQSISQDSIPKKEIPQLKRLEKKQKEQKPTTESQSCFMFDFGNNVGGNKCWLEPILPLLSL